MTANTTKRKLPPGVHYEAKAGKYRWTVQRDGQRHTSRYFDTPTEAANDRARVVLELSRGTHLATDKTTVAEYLASYLERKANHLAAKTLHGYQWCTKQYILPELGGVRLQQLKPIQVSAYYARLEKRGLAYSTRKHVHAVLHGAFKEALAFEIVHRNPFDAVKPAPPRQQTEDNRSDVWTPEELDAFLLVARQDYAGAALVFMVATGLRRGEACGLTWENVDLLNRRIHIRQNRVAIGGQPVTSTPKTKTSARTLPLSEDATRFLLTHQQRQRELRGIEGTAWQESGYVFTTGIGTPLHPDTLKRSMTRLCEAAGVKRIRIHDLRHTHASLMLRAGAPLDVVSKSLGHSRASFTADVYRHVYDSEQEDWALGLDELTQGGPRARRRSA